MNQDQPHQDKVVEYISLAVIEIMSTMAMTDLVYVGVESQEVFFLESEATGLVRLSGSHDGMLGVGTDQASLRVIVSRIIGVPEEALTREDLLDGVAELANMISGSFKARTRLGGMKLSSPVAVLGKEYVALWKTSKPTQLLMFQREGEGGALLVSISL